MATGDGSAVCAVDGIGRSHFALRLESSRRKKSGEETDIHPKPEESFDDVIRAAGGLVWRDAPDGKGKQIAIIRRSRYAGEGWTLPKGKVKAKDKTWKAAAEREVREETGCRVRVGDFAGCYGYTVRGKPKVVLYWNMNLIGEPDFRKSKEVDEVRWVTAREALKKLHYPSERALLRGSIQETQGRAARRSSTR